MSLEKNESLATRLTISRLINAPPERVFEAWTDPKQLVQWCYLPTMETRHTEINPIEGGNWTLAIRTSEGMDIRVKRVYREITPPMRLAFYELCKAGDKVLLDGVHTVTFAEEGHATRVTVTVELKNGFDADNQGGWNGGWNALFNHLATFVGANR
jgi:uncharacterized protein YndB with AHSA1/START domain